MLPAGGGLTLLDLLARRILAIGLEPLVRSGEVPSQDRDGALQALQLRPVETFDFHNDDAVTAQWAITNFTLLGPRLTTQLADRLHARYRPVEWWVELLFRYSSAPLEQNSRNNSLFETVFGVEQNEAEMHERLVTFLNLVGLVTSPVLVLDEVEGLSSSPEAGLQLATFLNILHQSCKKLALIISVNGDIWETAFLPRLPCGLKDRLNDIVVDLQPLSREDALAILRDRAGERADEIAEALDFDKGVVYPRGLIREASAIWSQMIAEEAQENEELVDWAAEILPDEGIISAGAGVGSGASPAGSPDSSAAAPFEPDVAREKSDASLPNVFDPLEQPGQTGVSGPSLESLVQLIDPETGASDASGTEAAQQVSTQVTESPFFTHPDLVTGTADIKSPQQAPDEAGVSSPSPLYDQDETVAPPNAVTQEDHDKIDSLLKQFRDRYGRG